LSLHENQISDLEPLYELPNLKSLSIWQNPQISPEQIAEFRARQPKCFVS
jgi:Leucine-rich repeat (LRR) protein